MGWFLHNPTKGGGKNPQGGVGSPVGTFSLQHWVVFCGGVGVYVVVGMCVCREVRWGGGGDKGSVSVPVRTPVVQVCRRTL